MKKMIGMVVGLMVIALVSNLTRAEDKPAAPAAAPAAGAPAAPAAGKRTPEQIMPDLQTAGQELQKVITGAEVITDPAKRAETGPKAVEPLKKMISLATELVDSGDPEAATQGKAMRSQFLQLLATFGDDKTVADIQKQSEGTGESALDAKVAILASRWIKSSKDEAAQGKVVDDAVVLAKANPESTPLAQSLMSLSQFSAAKPELSDKLQSAVLDNMKGAFIDRVKESVAADKKLKSVEGKPLAIAGKTVDGKDFTTADWKGKVVLIDFWATWCGPCVQELPRVKKAYADFHEKGLEILGVSNDQQVDALKKFVAADPAMPWPQLFDAAAAAKGDWNPITQGFGINGIPTMFLIDKKGVCRTVSARENFEELIPKMLAE